MTMSADKPGSGGDVNDLSIILDNPYLRAVLDELRYVDAWKSGQVSPISAAVRVRQIRNAHLVPDGAK